MHLHGNDQSCPLQALAVAVARALRCRPQMTAFCGTVPARPRREPEDQLPRGPKTHTPQSEAGEPPNLTGTTSPKRLRYLLLQSRPDRALLMSSLLPLIGQR